VTILTGFWSETYVVSHSVREVKLHPIEENVFSLEFILKIPKRTRFQNSKEDTFSGIGCKSI
jgi:hypothetical protein